MPWELGAYYHTKFPIRYEMRTDPVTGKRDGLGARVPAGLEPKIFHVDTGSEQWGQGRVATLLHTSIDGREDLSDPPNVRIYYLAGAKHGAGSWPPAKSDGQQELVNPLDYRYASRPLLAALDRWVREGVEPPASQHPRWSDGTMVAVSKLEYPDIPGVQWPPANAPGSYRVDVSGPATVLPFLVSQVDGDGNEIGGLRLPEQTVPLGTYRGWAFRSESAGLPNTHVPYCGRIHTVRQNARRTAAKRRSTSVGRGTLLQSRRLRAASGGSGQPDGAGTVPAAGGRRGHCRSRRRALGLDDVGENEPETPTKPPEDK